MMERAGGRGAVVLLSGGLDSATALALAVREGFRVFTLSFRYGQRHHGELEAARQLAARARASRHLELEIDLRQFGGSALTAEIELPKGRRRPELAEGIPVSYVPARNTIFLSYALAWAEVLAVDDIFIGVNAIDYSGYPDCRPEYIAAYERLANLATKRALEGHRLRIHAPLIGLSKAQIIQLGRDLGVDYSLTRSCYELSVDGAACGECDACLLRLRGFAEAGVTDPASYRTPARPAVAP